MSDDNPNIPEPWVIEQQIRELAYYKWEQAGCPNDMDIHFWLDAQHEVWTSYGKNNGETND